MLSPNRIQSDPHCWNCRKFQQKEPRLECHTCIRTYHKKCVIKFGDDFNGQWQCQECTEVEKSVKDSHISQSNLHGCLKSLYHRLIDDEEYMELNTLQHKDVVNPVDFTTLKSKIVDLHYKSTVDFLLDISWMVHNTLIRESSIRIKKIAKEFAFYCKNECNFIDTCEYCYALASSASKNWFPEVCAKKHEVVWAKVMGYKYAPAKLMQIGESSVTVHFFEDHAFASIPLQFCKGFSEKCPNQNFKLTAKAGQEVREYKKNLEQSFICTTFGEKVDSPIENSRPSTTTAPGETLDTPIEKSGPSTSTAEQKLDTPIENSRPSTTTAPGETLDTPIEKSRPFTTTIESIAEEKSNALLNISSTSRSDEKSDASFEMGHCSTTGTTPDCSQFPSIRKTVIDMLDKNEEQFKRLSQNFAFKEEQYQKKINELEQSLANQRKDHETTVRELKRKKWCDYCSEETKTANKIFCSNNCGSKWYQDAVTVSDDPHLPASQNGP